MSDSASRDESAEGALPATGGLDALGAPREELRAPFEWRPLAILFAFAGFFVWWNWGIWADPIVDFGRELYVPWRLSEGEVLGRDLAWFNGPLSQHVNALLFAVFGVSLRTIVLANLVWTSVAIVVLYRSLRFVASERSATIGALSFVTMCAFSQHEGIANFNWLCPYSHELTHGVLLGLVAIYALCSWLARGRAVLLVAGGLACGLCFLTKPETFLATSAGAIAALLVGARIGRGALLGALILGASAAIPVAGAWLWLASISDAENATSLVIGAWKHVGNPHLSALLFYKSSLGLDAPMWRLAYMALTSLAWLACVAVAYALGRFAAARPQKEGAIAVVSALVIAGLLGFALGAFTARHVAFEIAFTPLPLALVVALLAYAKDSFVHKDARVAARIPLLVFALTLLAKLGLFSRVHHYGFALAVPALAIVVALATEALPRWLAKRRASILVTRAVLFGVVIGVAIVAFRINSHYRDAKVEFVGDGADRMRAVEGSWRINLILDPLRRVLGEDETVLVLPEGITLNYWLKRRTPIRVLNFMPPELIMFGEGEIIRELRESPPDYVIFHTRLTLEYGYPLFGTHYARSIVMWLRSNYEILEQASLGPDPLDIERVEDRAVGWRVWKRKR